MSQLYSFLYSSIFTPSYPITVVGELVKAARRKNAAQGLTGILVFDGVRFCQYLEGPQQNLADILATIENDPRHSDFRLHFHEQLDGPRQFRDWSIAYAEVEDEILLQELAAAQGQEALLHLRNLLPSLDFC